MSGFAGIDLVCNAEVFLYSLTGVAKISQPVLLHVMSESIGMALDRGQSFVHDLWVKIRNSCVNDRSDMARHKLRKMLSNPR